MKSQVLIIGGGISGMAAAKILKDAGIESIIAEKAEEAGGLCRSFSMGDAWFDYGGHCTFARDPFVRSMLESGVEYNSLEADAINYKKGKWIKNPAQINLYPMDTDEKIRIITGFVDRPAFEEIKNYDQWLRATYGNYFAENYPTLYTKKYWTVSPEQLETKWVGQRMYPPTLKEVLYGAFETDTPNVHYSNGIRYPLTGGFEAFLGEMKKTANIKYSKNVIEINIKEKKAVFEDGESLGFDDLIFCAPLCDIVPVIKGVPDLVAKCSKDLNHTSLVLVSFHLKQPFKSPYGIIYIYDEDILPSRVFSTNIYSNKTTGSYALQAEVYYSRFKKQDKSLEEIRDIVRKQLVSIGVMDEKDIVEADVRYEKYANVMFTHDIYDNRKIVHDYLDSVGIKYAGRFGEWDYLWTDQAILSGKRAAESIISSKY